MKQAVVSGLVAGAVVGAVMLGMAVDWAAVASWAGDAAPTSSGVLSVVSVVVTLLVTVLAAICACAGFYVFGMAFIEEDGWSYKLREAGKGLALAAGSLLWGAVTTLAINMWF